MVDWMIRKIIHHLCPKILKDEKIKAQQVLTEMVHVHLLFSSHWICNQVYGNSNCFEVKVGLHQGSALSPLLFVIVVEAIAREFRVALL